MCSHNNYINTTKNVSIQKLAEQNIMEQSRKRILGLLRIFSLVYAYNITSPNCKGAVISFVNLFTRFVNRKYKNFYCDEGVSKSKCSNLETVIFFSSNHPNMQMENDINFTTSRNNWFLFLPLTNKRAFHSSKYKYFESKSFILAYQSHTPNEEENHVLQ